MTVTTDVQLPGAAAMVRDGQGIVGPLDVPLWMTQGGAEARTAARAMASGADLVRRVGGTVRVVVLDASTALHWQGSAAAAAAGRVRSLDTQLAAVASQFDAAAAALDGLAEALDAQQPVLGSPSTAWARAVAHPDQQVALLRRWQPAVRSLDTVDARTDQALREVAAALARVHATLTVPGGTSGAPPGAHGESVLSAIGRSVGTFLAGTVNALASLGNSVGQHPGSSAELVGGYLLTALGLGGEALGLGLDATGIGAVVGVPADVVSAGVITTGAGLMATAAGSLGRSAVGEDHVTLMEAGDDPPPGGASGGSGAPPDVSSVVSRLDVEGAQFAQRSARLTFSDDGAFRGRTIDDVAQELRDGTLTPDDVPVDMIVRDGRSVILNTRSALALQEAGVPRGAWRVVDRTGQAGYEVRLTGQLSRNGLDAGGTSQVRIKGRGLG